MKTSFRLILTLSAALSIGIAAAAQEVQSLNGTWDFSLRKAGEPEPKSYSGKIAVPSCWAVLGWEEPVYRGFKDDQASEGWYRTTFELPSGWEGKRVRLHFGGVWACAEPKLNGHELGAHDSGFTSFAYDVTKFLQSGENTLEVRVIQASRYYQFDTHDDWSLGGIYRDVWLESMPKDRWLEKPTVLTGFDSKYNDADLTVKVVVCDTHKSRVDGNFPSKSDEYTLRYTLKDAEGNTVISTDNELSIARVKGQDATDKEVVRTFKVKKPHQWNAEHPYLYTLTVDLVENEETVHSRCEKVGFREISTEGGVFKINGVAVKLRGVNRHDEYPDVGRATRHEHWLKDLQMMKDNNINYIRCAHYTPARGFVEMCDSIGMYISDEVEMGGGDAYFRDPSYSEGVLQRAYETVIRDLNSPSVIFWTIGNEDPFTSIHLAARKMVKALDPTRPAAMPWRAEEWMPEEFEILAPHYWQPAEYDSLATQSGRPIVTTEYTHAYGTHATGGLEARWKAITQHPTGAGGAIWMWQDQGIKTPVLPEHPSSISDDPYMRIDGQGWDGLVDPYRNPTRDLEEAKAVYAQVYPAVESVKAAKKVKIPIANEYDFTDLSEVTIRWEQFADEKSVASGETSISGKPHSTAKLKIRLAKEYGIYANYLMLTFLRADGSEITHRSVELTGKTSYTPSKYTDVLDAEHLLNALRPVIWHRLDDTEQMMYSKDEKAILNEVDFDKYTLEPVSSDVRTEGDEEIRTVKNRYVIDSLDSFTVDYEIRTSETAVKVKYTITPEVRLSWLPVYGMAFKWGSVKGIRWIGEGPEDGYPNKKSAPQFGLWEYGGGFKADRSVLLDLWEGTLKIDNDGYFERSQDKPEEILILKETVSRPEKGRKAVDPFPLLRTEEDTPFSGEITITLK